MKAIMVCVDYGDLLSLTLPYNKHHFEQMLVVTAPRDRETQNICEVYCAISLTHSTLTALSSISGWH
jgi:hypothetical protein